MEGAGLRKAHLLRNVEQWQVGAGKVLNVPSINARLPEKLNTWFAWIEQELCGARYAVNLIVRSAGDSRYEADLTLMERFKPPW
jgi:hypothetical protein